MGTGRTHRPTSALTAALLDEFEIHVIPVPLVNVRRLFEDLGSE